MKERGFFSTCLKRGQRIDVGDVTFFIRKGGSNNYRVHVLAPRDLVINRTDTYGPMAQSAEEWHKHNHEKSLNHAEFYQAEKKKAANTLADRDEASAGHAADTSEEHS